MLKSARHAALPIGIVLLLSACGQEADAPDAGPENAAAAPQAATPAADGGATSSLWRGGAAVPLDIQAPHPNGTVLQITSLQSRPTETVVGVRVINGDDREVLLNRNNNNRNGFIVVDSGERIYLSPPAANRTLSIQAGQTMEGELVFLGRLPQAQTGILILNENSSIDSEYTNAPAFRINLPLQDAPAATGAAQ